MPALHPDMDFYFSIKTVERNSKTKNKVEISEKSLMTLQLTGLALITTMEMSGGFQGELVQRFSR